MTFIKASDGHDLLGLILAGGKSLRMQQAKAHLVINKHPQWQICEQILKPYCSEVYFSVSPQLIPPLPVASERLIEDIFVNPIGPLGGIMSAFSKYPQVAFFVLACDLPFFNDQAVRLLLSERDPNKKATVFFSNSGIEPLCGIYEPDVFSELAVFFSKGLYCPRAILHRLDIKKVSIVDDRLVTNLNYAKQLDDLKARYKEKRVTLHYYASLREKTDRFEETLVTKATTIQDLFNELKQKYLWTLEEQTLRFAKNDRLVGKDDFIDDEDVIVFIPPVSGG